MKTQTGETIKMGKDIFLFVILFCYFSLINAQTGKDYDKQKAKLTRKVGRQVMESDFVRTVTTNKISFWGDDTGNHGFTSFVGAADGMVMGSLAKYYSYQNYYHGPRGINIRHSSTDSDNISALEIMNVTFADEDGDGALGKRESAQVYFDIINTGDNSLFGIVPVLMANKTRHVRITAAVPIDTLEAESALRYVIELKGDGKRNPGKIKLLLRIKYGKGQYWDVGQFFLGKE